MARSTLFFQRSCTKMVSYVVIVLQRLTVTLHFRYHPWSFVYSPGWVQIKCDLRILSQLSFNLNPDWELPVKKETNNQPLKDGVRDMLVKHHLFSWDI